MSKFGDNIRILRLKRGYSQAEMAKLFTCATGIELKRSTLGNYEQGIREPDFDTVEAFADFFDVSISDLMGREEETIPIKDSTIPKTFEARIVSGGMDKLPKAQREQILAVVRAMFANNPDLFK